MTPGFKKLTFLRIIIVGAGPSGQILGLLLAEHGVPTTIIEQSLQLDENPRATHYGPPALRIFNQLGIGDEVRSRGFVPDELAWRKPDGTYLAGINHVFLGDNPERITALPLNQLGKLLMEHGRKQPKLEYRFGQEVVGIGQDKSQAWVETQDVKTKEKSRFFADYIVGCDGANSIVRRSLFGDLEFPGKTWDEQIVATNVYYDFSKYGYSDANFIIDPRNWHMASKITKDGMWRVTYGEIPGLTRDEMIARQPDKFRKILPDHPEPGEYTLVSISPYKTHQRLASHMRAGRFLLAADAAHLCNPFGGLGLTGGIVDIGDLYQCLAGIYDNKVSDAILDVWDRIRRQKFSEIIDPISSDNLKRMYAIHPDEVLEKDEFLQLCKVAETDVELRRNLIMGSHDLSYDFTQHFS